jgi:hypothetical protein
LPIVLAIFRQQPDHPVAQGELAINPRVGWEGLEELAYHGGRQPASAGAA